MALVQDREQALIALARRLDSSPLPASERACLVKLADGSTRLGITQVVQFVNHGGEFPGALFCRISFRYAGQDTVDDKAAYSSTHDVAWFIVDHKTGTVQFGPLSGLQVRCPGLGIGSYIIGQLIRLLHGGTAQGNYRVRTFNVSLDVRAALPSADVKVNDAKINFVFERAGFYVSQAAGKRVIGARRAADLRSQWNGEKVRFLNPGQLIDTAATALADCIAATDRTAAIVQERDQLLASQDKLSRDLGSATAELAGVAAQLEQSEQALRINEVDHAAEVEGYTAMIADLKTRLDSNADLVLPPAPEKNEAAEKSAAVTTMVIELGKTARIACWAAIFCSLALTSVFLFAALAR